MVSISTPLNDRCASHSAINPGQTIILSISLMKLILHDSLLIHKFTALYTCTSQVLNIFLRSYLLNIWRQTNPISHNLQLFSHLRVFSLPYLTILVFCLQYFVSISWRIWLNLLMINFNWSTRNFFIGKTRQEVQFQRKIQLKPDRWTGDRWPCEFVLCIICICILDLYSLEEKTLSRRKF